VSGRSRALLALLGYLVAGLVLTHPLWGDPQTRTIGGGGGDAALFLWFLASTSSAVWHHGGHGLLLTHALNAPTGVSTLWNTSLLLPGLLLSPVTEAAGPVLTLNLLLLLGPVLSAWSAYLCSGRYLQRTSARLVTGLVFGFSPALLSAELGHLHLTLLPLVPPLLLAVVDAATGRRPAVRGGLLLGGLVAAQLLIGEEVLALTAVTGAVVLVVLAAQHRDLVRRRLRPLLVSSAVAVGVVLVVDGWPLLAQFAGAQSVHGAVQPRDVYVLDPVTLAVPNSVPAWHLPLLGSIPALHLNDAEDMGYLGLPLLVLLGVVLWRRRGDERVRTAVVSALVLVVLALGPTLHLAGGAKHLPLPWKLTSPLPVLGSLLPVRLMLLVDLLLALLLGLWLDGLRAGRSHLLGLAAVVVALAPLVPHPLPNVRPTRTPAFFLAGAPGLRGGALVLPFPRHHNAIAMSWQAQAGLRFSMPGGFFIGPQKDGEAGFDTYPPLPTQAVLVGLVEQGRCPEITPALRSQAGADLRRWGTRAVVLGPAPYERAGVAWLTALLHRAPEHTGGVWLWRDVTPQAVEQPPAAPAAPGTPRPPAPC
jgi:hypothetical protein